MGTTRQVPDEAAITNHYTATFSPWVVNGNFMTLSGLNDETEVIAGPDQRGYMTGQPQHQSLTVSVPTNDPTALLLGVWKDAQEAGNPGARAIGTVIIMTAANVPVATYELLDCLCHAVTPDDLGVESAKVGMETYKIAYSRCRRIG